MLLLKVGLLVLSVLHTLNAYEYNEELLVENLPGSHALLHFEFTSFWQNDQTNNQGDFILSINQRFYDFNK